MAPRIFRIQRQTSLFRASASRCSIRCAGGLKPAPFERAGHIAVDRALQQTSTAERQPTTVRLALLGSSTVDNPIPGIRVAALRHGLSIRSWLGSYGQYRQDLCGPSPARDAGDGRGLAAAPSMIGPFTSGVACPTSGCLRLRQLPSSRYCTWAASANFLTGSSSEIRRTWP
jgi:hypothetical protein